MTFIYIFWENSNRYSQIHLLLPPQSTFQLQEYYIIYNRNCFESHGLVVGPPCDASSGTPLGTHRSVSNNRHLIDLLFLVIFQ